MARHAAHRGCGGEAQAVHAPLWPHSGKWARAWESPKGQLSAGSGSGRSTKMRYLEVSSDLEKSGTQGLPRPRGSTWHLALNLLRFLSHFSSLSRCLWMMPSVRGAPALLSFPSPANAGVLSALGVIDKDTEKPQS